MKNEVIAVGSVLKDIFIFSDRGKIFETPRDKLAPRWLGYELGEKILVDSVEECLGGTATNISVGLAKMGIRTGVYSQIGDDDLGHWIKEKIYSLGVNVANLRLKKSFKTPISMILVDKKSGERVIFYQSSSGRIDLSKLSKVKCKWLFVSSLTGRWKEQADEILRKIKKEKINLAIAPSTSQIRDDFYDLSRLIEKADIIFLNKNEALEIASKVNSRAQTEIELLRLMHRIGVKIVSLTDGVRGAWSSDAKKIRYEKVKKVKAVDTTGAGDAYASAFLGFYLRSYSIRTSMKAGIINSSSVVRAVGTTAGILDYEKIDRLIK